MSNVLGGKNEAARYTPMTEVEQEFLDRLRDREDLVLEICGWGTIENPKINFGDLRLSIPISITFNSPELHVPVYYFDLELRIKDGPLLFKKREVSMVGNNPILVGAGTNLQMIWDIAIRQIDPALIKEMMPGVIGLTTREGNRHLNSLEQGFLDHVRRGESFVRDYAKREIEEATKRESEDKSIRKLQVG